MPLFKRKPKTPPADTFEKFLAHFREQNERALNAFRNKNPENFEERGGRK